MSEKLNRAAATIGRHLDKIRAEVFLPEHANTMKLTFIARDPSNPEADIFISEDDIDGVIDLLRRSVERAAI